MNLEELYLNDNQIDAVTNISRYIRTLLNCTVRGSNVFVIVWSFFTDLRIIAVACGRCPCSLTKLQELHLGDNRLSSIEELGPIPSLLVRFVWMNECVCVDE